MHLPAGHSRETRPLCAFSLTRSPKRLMQNIAMENNLAETAFITRGRDEWLIQVVHSGHGG